jgi:hypothetical protein
MSETIDRIVRDPIAAHQAALAAYQLCKALTIARRPARITACEYEDDRSLAANRYYWGVVLKEISEQAIICGQRWTADAFHELFKRQFLGYEIKKYTVAGRRKKQVIRRLKSTTGLKIKAFATYIEKIQAFAATELAVTFSSDWFE